ncbi:MAG TPA: M3 family metallopeptidase [candidate division Zixibacteria bacterium]|nr:M3 family metallopeptidase [candidate division Zixibacteria bacterium]
MTKTNIAWDLTEIFPSKTDPSVQKAIDSIGRMAEQFADRYQGKIGSLSAQHLAECLREFEAYRAKLGDVTLFSELSFAANMTLPETQSLHDKVMKIEAKLGKALAFFELEVGALASRNSRMISDPALENYRHTLERFNRLASHHLSEVEEQLTIEKDQYGVKAWEELQMKWLNTRTFEVEVEGKKKTLPFGEASGLFSHPDRTTRESAYKSIYGLVGVYGEIFSAALRNTCNDWLNVCERRRYDSPMHASLIENDIEQQPIDNLLRAVEDQAGKYRRFLKLKAKMMGLPRLSCHDILAPLPDVPRATMSYARARELVIRAYSRFDEDYASAVKDMFVRNHLDSSPRFGKQNGAFCASWYNGKSAFVLDSFNGRLRDVYTLAHELGHATHDYYAQPRQTLLNLRTPMVVAETASIFGELLLTDLLLSEAKTDAEKKVILTSVLDMAGTPLFRVTSRAWFEQSLYDALNKGDYLDFETMCKQWTTARDRIYRDAVEWFSVMKAEWTTVPHYYMANFRFYNYPYVYAQLFVYALYQKYLEEGSRFVPKFKKMLSAGSSVSPLEIGKIADLDVNDPDFWKLGTKQYEHFINELEKIVL